MAENLDSDNPLSIHAEQRLDSDDDDVSLDASFFLNENYQLQKFTFGTETIELYCLQSSLTDYDLTGQLVWPGAKLLAEYLLEKANDIKGFSVIELGAGLGLTGLLCARLCDHVVITDYNETILKVTQMNVDHQISSGDLSPCKVEVHKLDWSVEDHMVAIKEKYPQGFDLTRYQQSCLPPLFSTLRKFLKQQRARPNVAFLGYVSRWKSMDEAVCCEATKLDLEIKEVPGTRKEAVSGLYEGWIYEISLRP
ncbi:hypothetical protein R1flu_020691 [Riccia fluitans]|uniref:Uncharacterized protein n=1 Tax=Riccia fluitans TaxID=41844 RepID=A0ABD1ZMF8_9MARC